ncbi:MAG: RHS repeat-associated core domain-containing protein [Bacteroidota bacterium]
MKNLSFLVFLLVFQITFGQDTFSYKTIKASQVNQSEEELTGASSGTVSLSSKSSGLASRGGGTVNGSTMGSLNITSTGAATYAIPIDVPPGLNGIQPEVALAYNSQSGNGLAGWGWNVSGISVITRIPTTSFHDNQIDPVDFDLDDRFALDGQRLILKTGSYGVSGSEYQTEQYSNLKIVAYGSHPTSGVQGPSYFKVFYPDGSVGVYGNTSGTRSRTDYAISYWENPQGLRITYTYTTSDNSLRINKISYGSRGTAAPVNEIEFVYKDRERDEQSYVGGVRFIRKHILSEIKVKGNGTAYRNYLLQHDATPLLDFERLISVQEKTGDNLLSRSPITFTYASSSNTITKIDRTSQLTVQNIEQRNAKVVSLDITGNGKMDFAVYPTTGSDAKKKFWLFNDIQNSSNLNFGIEVNTGLFENIFPVSWLNFDYKLLPNQGLTVVQNSGGTQVKFKVYSYGGAASPISYKYEKTWNAPSYTYYTSCGNGEQRRIKQRYVSGDFDGDGLSDVLAIANGSYDQNICYPSGQGCSCNSTYVTPNRVELIKLDRRLTSNFSSFVGTLSNALSINDQLITSDVNGDGKTDLVRFKDGLVEVYGLNHANNSLDLLWSKSDSVIDLDRPILPGDYNGDGKFDFMVPTANNSYQYAMFLSTGTGYYKNQAFQPFQYKETDYNGQGTLYGYNLIPVDINGDSRTDIIDYRTTTYNNSSNGYQVFTVYHNAKPLGSGAFPDFEYTGGTSSTGNLKHFPIPVFLNSADRPNNNLDFASISDNHITSFEFQKDHRADITLEQIENNGVSTALTYGEVNSYYNGGFDPAYYPAYDEIYPFINVNVAPSLKVVKELEQNGDGITRNQKFYYEGAVSHASGLGFMGFEVLKRTNWYGDNVGVLWTITRQDPMLRGAVTEQIVANTSSSNPSTYMSKVNYFYDYQLIANPGSPIAPQYTENINRSSSLSGSQTDEAELTINLFPGFHAIGSNGTYLGRIVPPNEQPGDTGYAGAADIRLNRMETDNGLTGVTTIETYSYDQYNNPVATTTSYPGGSRVVNYQYLNNPSATNNTFHVGRVQRMTETISLNGNTFNSEEQYSYNNNLVTQIKKKGNGTNWLTEDFQHDIYGNVLSKTLTASGLATRTETFEYAVTYGGRFLTKSTDIEGLETTFVYNSSTGNLVSTTNPYGLTTTYVNDKWDRVERMTDYLGNDTDYTYTPQSSGGQINTVDYATGAKEETIYNAFGWVTRSGTLSLNNQWIYKSFEYDASGRKKRESEPHNGSPNQWNTYAFDEYGRPITQTLFTGRSISFTYSNLSTTVNDGTKSVTTTLDALGNTIQLQDPGGTIDYTFFANGTLKTADYGGHVITVGIDGWGRKTSLTDPSAGTYTYDYDDFGQLLEETTPKGTTTYVYDAFGKVTSKTMTGDLTDHTLTYVYDNLTKMLTTINGQDNTNSARAYSYIYEYDTYERLKKVTENTGLASFEQEFTFDPVYGRIWKEKLTSSLVGGISKTITTRNEYDTSGLLKEIWNDGTPDKLWELDQINARGQALTVNLGNGMVQNKTYDTYGYLTKIEDKETGTNPSVALHTEYDFHQQRGILNSRENFGFSWQETFTHDNLDRLTAIAGDVSHTKTYDARGNIATNTDLGDYTYGDTGKKYRLTEIDPNTAGTTYFQQHPTQQVSYNAFKKPIEIHQTGHGRVSFEYGPMMNRSTAYYGGEQEDRTQRRYKKHYSAIIPVEIVQDTQTGNSKIITYVTGDAYSATIAHIKTTGTGAVDEYHYLHRDYLGSILAITDSNGNIKEERQFGAWGVVDQFLDSGGGTAFTHASLLGRGYTGHEHFFEVGLIHMNGRMYDAQVGRFLSPDNFIQDPYNTQNYNRYGYVLNNPLVVADPNGELFWFAVGIGALIGGISQAIKPGANFGSILGGALIGAAAGGLGFGVGNVVGGGTFFGSNIASTLGFGQGFASGFAGGFTGGFVGGAGNAWLNGESFGNGLLGGLITGGFGGLTAGFVNGVTSGIRANKQGLGFWNGKESYSDYFRNKADAIKKGINGLNLRDNQEFGLDYYYDAIDGMELPNGYVLNRNNVHITLNPDPGGNARYLGYKGWKHHVNFDIGDFQITADNIRATMVHEVYGHGIMGYTDSLNNHYKAYFTSIDSKYWGATTLDFKQFTVNWMYKYFYDELGGTRLLPSKYLNVFKKYQTLYKK